MKKKITKYDFENIYSYLNNKLNIKYIKYTVNKMII